MRIWEGPFTSRQAAEKYVKDKMREQLYQILAEREHRRWTDTVMVPVYQLQVNGVAIAGSECWEPMSDLLRDPYAIRINGGYYRRSA